ncbi:MAG: sugar phosphate isomerase/epimerase [Clostridiales bacterium]|nr:sugar phosphate isomerase/epimerase [Clostridiales bacterium]
MDKGICLFFGYHSPLKERLQKVKDIGFTTIMTSASKKYKKQNGSLKSQVKLIDQVGLKKSSLHASYYTPDLPNFFTDNKIGNKLEKQLIKEVKIAKKYGFKCLVVHLKGENTEVGLERLKRILKVCRKYDLPLALENISETKILEYIFDNINDEYLRFCWDAGHNLCFSKRKNYLKKYLDKVITLHLHDNDGTSDQHTLNQFGIRDWDDTAKLLSKVKNISLDYELLMDVCPKNLTEDEALAMCYKNACELEKMIKNQI